MSYPPPPGLKSSSAQPPASLPARPPPSIVSPPPAFKPPTVGVSARPAFTAFAPRSVTSASTHRTNSPAQYPAAPASSYNPPAQYQPPSVDYSSQPRYDGFPSAVPQIHNPFVPTTSDASANPSYPPGYDADYEAQVQQWQSAYMSNQLGNTSTTKPAVAQTTPTVAATARNDTTTQNHDVPKTVQRSGGGSSWTDPTLLEWNPAHFRIFVGNLAGEVTDESLLKAFSQYPSVQKARVIRDKRTTKSKGYGFVSFADGDDYFRAAREQNGKYVGSHPIVVKKAVTDVRASTVKQGNQKGKGGPGGHGKVQQGGVTKKQAKTKGGLKVLG